MWKQILRNSWSRYFDEKSSDTSLISEKTRNYRINISYDSSMQCKAWSCSKAVTSVDSLKNPRSPSIAERAAAAQPVSADLCAFQSSSHPRYCGTNIQVSSWSVCQLLARSEVEQRMLALEYRLDGLVTQKRNCDVSATAGNVRASNFDTDVRVCRLPNNPRTVVLEESHHPSRGKSIDT